MLTPEEIGAPLRACRSSRDRAIIAPLCESGCRIGELGRCNICDTGKAVYRSREAQEKICEVRAQRA